MDILTQKEISEYDRKLKDIYLNFKFLNYPLQLKGSSALKANKYYSDYDLLTNIKDPIHSKKLYDEIMKIIEKNARNENLYFIELKIQNNNGEKFRYYKDDTFSFQKFNNQIRNIQFIKLDYIFWNEFRFIELSSIYNFNTEEFNKDKFIKDIENEIKEYYTKGNFFKILKRKFSIAKINNDKNEAIRLNKIFNSELGKLNQEKDNLETLLIINEHYPSDPLVRKRIEKNLIDLGLTPNLDLAHKIIIELQNKINNGVRKYIDI